jgi:two-component sensor histidine kinase
MIDARRATSLGLILNELLTNALKYAFPAERAGQIWIRLEQHDGELSLSVEDDGVGLPPGFNLDNPGGLGLQLVQILAHQLKGDFRAAGSAHPRFEVIVPL